MRYATINIHQDALKHNLARIKSMTKAHVLAMVKADAYGHGVSAVVPALIEADGFGVACLSEALSVKAVLDELAINKPIVLMEGVFDEQEWHTAVACGFWAVIHCQAQLDWACQTSAPSDYTPIWLKYNTGMNRLGFDKTALQKACQRLSDAGYELILTSHFACADDKNHPMNAKQIKDFEQMYQALSQQFDIKGSLCNSAGIIHFKHHHYDWVRSGIALYGSSPTGTDRDILGLKPAMTLSARIMATHHLKTGQSVGYGGQWRACKPSTIGIVSLGYGDGYPRVVNDASVLVMANTPTLCPIVGRVAMDMMAIDLTALPPQAWIDVPVVLWGQTPSIDTVANCAHTIAYELMCRLTMRPARQLS